MKHILACIYFGLQKFRVPDSIHTLVYTSTEARLAPGSSSLNPARFLVLVTYEPYCQFLGNYAFPGPLVCASVLSCTLVASVCPDTAVTTIIDKYTFTFPDSCLISRAFYIRTITTVPGKLAFPGPLNTWQVFIF